VRVEGRREERCGWRRQRRGGRISGGERRKAEGVSVVVQGRDMERRQERE